MGLILRRRGFSLMEVLFASLIFASAIGGLAAAWKFQEFSIRQYRNRNAARMLLEQEMARLTAHTYPNLEQAARDTTLQLNREVDGVVTRKEFVSTTTVTENSDATLKDITIRLDYVERNESKWIVLRTRVFRSE